MDEMMLEKIEQRRALLPAKLHAVHDPDADHFFPMGEPWGPLAEGDDQASTLSPVPDRHGWNNDSGFGGYGLPQPVAEALAALASDVDVLLAEVRQQRAELEAARRVVEAAKAPAVQPGYLLLSAEIGTYEAVVAHIGASHG